MLLDIVEGLRDAMQPLLDKNVLDVLLRRVLYVPQQLLKLLHSSTVGTVYPLQYSV